ncbi:hypothetical protein [Lacinutrix jangbogonensis]|uniref:hypothetical protein n=1 Tax=Lacinutrix jangbogonensis TaxID=1469557 RepID=UPI00053D5D9E|nr:hypothetical protein [Lacinutrix jangbogonensis]
MPYKIAAAANINILLSIGKSSPGGPGGLPDGEGGNCAVQTKLINTNKIEAIIFLFGIMYCF